MSCPHDIVERDVAVSADGYCPLCQAAEIAKLRAALEIAKDALQRDTGNYSFVLDAIDKALAGERKEALGEALIALATTGEDGCRMVLRAALNR